MLYIIRVSNIENYLYILKLIGKKGKNLYICIEIDLFLNI